MEEVERRLRRSRYRRRVAMKIHKDLRTNASGNPALVTVALPSRKIDIIEKKRIVIVSLEKDRVKHVGIKPRRLSRLRTSSKAHREAISFFFYFCHLPCCLVFFIPIFLQRFCFTLFSDGTGTREISVQRNGFR